jgi:DNA-binding NarL/FixJ family response regulator
MAEPRAIGVVVARFEDLVARGLRSLIEDDASLELLAADVAPEELDEVLGQLPARVALVALEELSTPVAVRELVTRHPGTEIVLLAERPSRIESAQLLAFGAAACLAKTTQGRDVLNAVHLASRGMQLAPREQPAGADPGMLTPREADVLVHLQHRRSNAQIAADLHISVETVRTHARSIYRKLGVGSRRELVPAPVRR